MRKGEENWLTYAPYWYERTDKKPKKRIPNVRDAQAPGLHACVKRVKSIFPAPIPCTPSLPPPYVPQIQKPPKSIYPSLSKEDIDFLAAATAVAQNANRLNPPTKKPNGSYRFGSQGHK